MVSYHKKSLEDVSVQGKRVLVRCDFNVPLKDGVITNDKRIVSSLPTIQYLVDHGARGFLLGGDLAVTALKEDRLAFPAGLTGPVSVFCPGEPAEGVSIEGLHYPLQDAVLTSGFPLGVSNQFTGVPASVSVRRGTLLVMWGESPASLLARL